MNCRKYTGEERYRIVGDPVDVVTGANLDRNLDFRLVGPLPLEWHRYYNSAQNERLCPLGWGHTHEYDRRLLLDVDGLSYIKSTGKSVGFPPLERDGDEFARTGVVLRRVASDIYLVREQRKPAMEFAFQDCSPVGLLKRVFRGDSSINFRYVPDRRLEMIIDSRGRTVRVRHDPAGRILELVLVGSATKEDRRILSCTYDEAGNLVQCVDPYRNPFTFKYDRNNRMISKTDRRGYSFLFEYDTEGRCTHSQGEDGLFEVRLEYSPKEQVTVVTRANGGQFTYFYNSAGTITKIVEPDGSVRTFNLDSKGRVSEEVDANGDVTKWIYGSSGALIGKRSSLGQFSTGDNRPVKPDKKAHRIPTRPLEWEYGRLFSPSRVMAPTADDSAVQQFSHSVRKLAREDRRHFSSALKGFDSSSANPGNGLNSGEVYDDFGLLIQEWDWSGKARRWNYDAAGNTVRYHDRDGLTYRYEYASANLRCRRVDPLGQVVSFGYTATALPAKITDPGGTCTDYVYDPKDRMVQVRRGGSLKEEYHYDLADNLIQKLDGNGNLLVTFEIGPQNLKTVRHLTSGENHYYVYDKLGRYAELATDEIKVRFEYDRWGYRTLDERDGRGVKHTFIGPRRLGSTIILNRFTISYHRLPDGATRITDPGGKHHFIRLAGNGLVVRTMSNGSSELTQFDAAGRCLLKEQTQSQRSEQPWIRTYSYSGEGDLIRVDDSLHGVVRYEHDAAHRLNRAIHNETFETYRYDAAGNLLEHPGLSGVTIGESNQLRTANGYEFEYNDRRHIGIRRGPNGETRYHYNSCDMLVRCETPQGDWQAAYDPLGRRTFKSFGGKRVEFYWDTDRLAAEVRQDGSLRIYIYADAFAMTPLLFVEYKTVDADPDSGNRYFLFANHISTPIRVEDEQGSVVWSARIDPYGTAHVPSGAAIEMPLRFPGHYLDSETGLHYNRFRYHNPELGRYLQSDPIGIAGGLNVYAYTSNPLRRVDVRGLAGDPPCETGATSEEDEESNFPAENWDAELSAEDEPQEEPEIDWDKVQESRDAYDRATDRAAELPKGSEDKTVAAAGDGVYASGTNQVKDFDHVPPDDVKSALGTDLFPPQEGKQDFLDNGDPGSYNASHAEMQAAAAQPGEPIGVSKEMCDNCYPAMQQIAQDSGEPQYVTDPSGTTVFHPNGGTTFLNWDEPPS
jgi:RHS repeat-associated protein